MVEDFVLEDYLSNPKRKTVEDIAERIFYAADYFTSFVILDIRDYDRDEDEINSCSTIFIKGEKDFYSREKSIFQLCYYGTGESDVDIPSEVTVRIYNPQSRVTGEVLDAVQKEFDRK